MEPVDLVVTGCVAVGEDGARLGQGRRIQRPGVRARGRGPDSWMHEPSWSRPSTRCRSGPPVAIPTTAHDIAVDLIVTPGSGTITTRRGRRRLPKLDWRELSDEKDRRHPAARHAARLNTAPRYDRNDAAVPRCSRGRRRSGCGFDGRIRPCLHHAVGIGQAAGRCAVRDVPERGLAQGIAGPDHACVDAVRSRCSCNAPRATPRLGPDEYRKTCATPCRRGPSCAGGRTRRGASRRGR